VQFIDAKRLVKIFVSRGIVAAHEDYGETGFSSAKASAEFVPVHAWHRYIGEQQIHLLAVGLKNFNGPSRAIRFESAVPCKLQHLGNETYHHRVVVHHQDSPSRFRSYLHVSNLRRNMFPKYPLKA
jgi:hypothetical protein